MKNKIYYNAADISDMLDVSRSIAYEIIRTLNGELKAKGYITISGKVSTAYFNHKWYGLDEPITENVILTQGELQYASI